MTQGFVTAGVKVFRTRPWIALAALLAVVLAAYYAFMGFRYVKASTETGSLEGRTDRLHASLQAGGAQQPSPPPNAEALVQERQRTTLKLFLYPETDTLVAAISAAAQDSGASLLSVTLGDAVPKTQAGVRYQGQPVTLTLQAGPDAVSRFLTAIQQAVPPMNVADISLSAQQGTPLTQLQLLFFLSPQSAANEKGAK